MRGPTHHDLANMSWHVKQRLARDLGVRVEQLPARLALRAKIQEGHRRWREREAARIAADQLDETPIHRCTCGAWRWEGHGCLSCERMHAGK